MPQLQNGETFPPLRAETVNHGQLTLPGDVPAGRFSVIIAYRAHWWPYCNRQVAGFQAKLNEFEQNEISVYALSTDDSEHAREMIEKHGLTFPVMYGINGPATADTWGSYYEERRNILQATNFILNPDHKIVTASYSTAAVGRIEPQDALNAVAFFKKQIAQS